MILFYTYVIGHKKKIGREQLRKASFVDRSWCLRREVLAFF